MFKIFSIQKIDTDYIAHICGIKINLSNIFSVKYANNNKNNRKIIRILGIKISLRKGKSTNISVQDKEEYLDYVLNQQLNTKDFAPEKKEAYQSKEDDVKLIAYYLPQYHAIAENDEWFVKGFTEWFNVSRAVPQFAGHWQPHLPIDVGYYSLDNLNVMKRQIELAKKFGISAFCFYYYWFNGQKLLEKPIEEFLQRSDLEIDFCLFWDSDNWTKTWNGGTSKDIMYAQKIEDNTPERFMQDFLKYAHDRRYIKIDNKPVLIISTPKAFKKPEIEYFMAQINEIAKREGFDGMYLISLMGNMNEDEIIDYKFNAMLEFLPLGIGNFINEKSEKFVNKKANCIAYDVEEFVKNKKYIYDTKCKVFKGCFTSWDNTARKCYKKAQIYQSTPKLYKEWLKDLIQWTKKNHRQEEQLVFINAWNEWAEGAHLEPDQKYGYAFLNATKEALEEA